MARVSQTNLLDQGRRAAVRVKKVVQEEGEDAMTVKEGEVVDGEGEAGTVDWRARADPRNKPTARETEEHEATHMPFRDWCTHCLMGRGRNHHHVSKQKSENLLRRPIVAMDSFSLANCELSCNTV